MKTHKDLEVWKQAIAFVTQLYQQTNSFKEIEKIEIKFFKIIIN